MSCTCERADIIVDYNHRHGLIQGVRVRDLQNSDPKTTRPIMTLESPRCATCSARLTKRELAQRTRQGGDLFDARFEWVW